MAYCNSSVELFKSRKINGNVFGGSPQNGFLSVGAKVKTTALEAGGGRGGGGLSTMAVRRTRGSDNHELLRKS